MIPLVRIHAYEPKEEGGLVGLKGFPRIDAFISGACILLWLKCRRGNEGFDELIGESIPKSNTAKGIWQIELGYLLEGFVVNKARGVFGNIELTLLDLLSKLPVRGNSLR